MRWIPIEANPDVINQFMAHVGIKSNWQCVDVYGTEREILEFLPKPVIALLLLYPITEAVVTNPIGENREDGDLIFFKQTIRNACGTIGLLHSLCNNRDKLGFQDDAYLKIFTEKIIPLNPEERGKYIEKEEYLSSIHEELALSGQSTAPNRAAETNLHFVSFIHKNGGLYELDGSEKGPKYHGACNEENFLYCAMDTIKKFMSRDPNEHNFNVIAIVKAE